jgi:hypothetical protein
MCRHVIQPVWLRPPVFFRRSIRLFSGVVFVISAYALTLLLRRAAVVGL